ncbi:hypothetical protein [Belnapia rosea]|uniref:Uncharacterized protein n=1 Tax=Belnapia rosea TaxID=938405 RepID=A0A1G6S4A0_9PROT|nr:hypothetical protein [Belnapia rosea]SDD11679.1 hypothetical protein SAMN04487779_1004270 [Belnapia rosea]
MHAFLAWALGLIGGAFFSIGLGGMWAQVVAALRSPAFGGYSATGWLVPTLLLALAAAAWAGAALIWAARPRPRAILPRHLGRGTAFRRRR